MKDRRTFELDLVPSVGCLCLALEAKLLADTLVSKSGYLDTQSAHPK
jgi:hypothetical protein